MPNPGKFVWYELMTADAGKAERFYRDVVGWGAQRADTPAMPYTMFTAGETPVVGLMTVTPQMQSEGAGPGWLGYISTSAIDATAAKARAAGGRIFREPTDMPGIGRFAVVGDPQGGGFALFQPAGSGQESPASMTAVGHAGWNELRTSEPDAAWEFYSGLFGWKKTQSMDMGAAGPYQLFASGENDIGAMMRSDGQPYWKFYFNVADIGAAAKAIAAGGGKVVNGPMEVPGGGWMVEGTDPEGVRFSLTGPRGSA